MGSPQASPTPKIRGIMKCTALVSLCTIFIRCRVREPAGEMKAGCGSDGVSANFRALGSDSKSFERDRRVSGERFQARKSPAIPDGTAIGHIDLWLEPGVSPNSASGIWFRPWCSNTARIASKLTHMLFIRFVLALSPLGGITPGGWLVDLASRPP